MLTSASFVKINSRKALNGQQFEKSTHRAALCLPIVTPQEYVPCMPGDPACNSFSGNKNNQQIKFACKVILSWISKVVLILPFMCTDLLKQQVLSVYLLVLQTRSDDPSENECRSNIDIPLAGFVVGKSHHLF